MDIFKIDKNSVFIAIDVATRFSAAVFLTEGKVRNQVWNAFLQCWALIYAGLPDIIFCHQGSVFKYYIWEKLSKENGVQLKFSRGSTFHLCKPRARKLGVNVLNFKQLRKR